VTVLVLYAFLAAIAAIVLFALFIFVLPKGEQIAVAVPDSAPWGLPAEATLTADDIVSLRLPVGLRGYRFAEADVLLDRLADELRRRDAEIAWLRGGRIGPDPSLVAEPPETPNPHEAPNPNPHEAPNPNPNPFARRDTDELPAVRSDPAPHEHLAPAPSDD
jgi:DivIVA domain-containing protein